MRSPLYLSFTEVYHDLRMLIKEAPIVHSAKWQGIDIANNPWMACKEITHVSFRVGMPTEELDYYRWDTDAEMPWSDDHFLERVSGYPMNPGTEWMNWSQNKRYGDGAKSFLDHRGKFNHNYMERYWPRFAGQVAEPTKDAQEWRKGFSASHKGVTPTPNKGILYEYGQLIDVVDLLAADPYTRQAYLPVWFPEDTGGGNKRAPCTIGYHFLMREGKLDINYHIRSCDLYKHFRNDLYLTVRLLLWVLDKVRSRNPDFKEVKPGRFMMQIGSLHLFKPDWEMV